MGIRTRGIETVIEQLIAFAKGTREAERRSQALGLSDEEAAFYEALEVNDSAVKVLRDAVRR